MQKFTVLNKIREQSVTGVGVVWEQITELRC